MLNATNYFRHSGARESQTFSGWGETSSLDRCEKDAHSYERIFRNSIAMRNSIALEFLQNMFLER